MTAAPDGTRYLSRNTSPHTSETAVVQTECMPGALAFQGVAGREVVARFNGGTLTSDGGAVLLREAFRRRIC